MKYTLLELVQRILEAMGDDEVNSISDTLRGTQVANIIEENFWEIVGLGDPSEHWDFYHLDATSSSTPTIMTLPSGAVTLDLLKYDKQTSTDSDAVYDQVSFLPMTEFLERNHGLDVDSTNVSSFTYSIDGQAFTFFYTNDQHPRYFTTWDDHTLVFDSFDSAEESMLTASRTQAYGLVEPTFTISDAFIPDLDGRQFSLLLQASKAQAFEEVKQTRLKSAEVKERRGWSILGRTKQGVKGSSALDRLPDYGRKVGIR